MLSIDSKKMFFFSFSANNRMVRIKTTPRILRMEVPNISELDEYWSDEVIVREIPWKFKVCKQDYDSQLSLCVYLYCEDQSPKKSHLASSTVKLLSEKDPIEKVTEPDIFDNSDLGSGRGIIPWSDLMDASKGYITENNAINLQMSIKVNDPNDNQASKLQFENLDKCCDEGGLTTYRLTITNIENLMAVKSPQFVLRNMPWQLTVFQNHLRHLAIRLESNEKSEGFTCDVIFTMNLKSSVNSIELIEVKQFKSYTFHSIAWSDLPWNELLNPENGFVENDQIVIEIEIKANKPVDVDQNTRKRKAKSIQSKAKSAKVMCTVCSKPIGSRQNTSFTPCGHLFCTPCIRNAIKRNRVCPNTSCGRRIILKQLQRAHLSL